MKNLITTFWVAVLLAGTPGFSSDEVKCTCDHQCAKECKEGKENKTCDCKACDCAKTGQCPHHVCGQKNTKPEPTKK